VNRPLRVAYLSRYLPAPSETFVLDEALSLRSAGASVVSCALDRVPRAIGHRRFEALYRETAFVPRPSNPATLYASLVLDGHSMMPMLRAHWGAVGRSRDLRRACWLARHLRSLDVDVLRVHHAAETARFGAVAATLAGIPLSIAVHGRDLFVPVSDLGWILNQAAHVSTVTPFHRERLLRAGLPSAQVSMLPCTVSLPPEVALPPKPGPLRILSVGRLVPKKGHDLLMDAAYSLARRGRAVELVIVGGGALGLELHQQASRQMAAAEGLLSVELRGDEAAETVQDLMLRGRFHCFALACRVAEDGDRDGLPVSLLEAQACGLPTVTTALPGFESQLADDRDGFLLPMTGRRRRVSDANQPEPESLAAALACLQDVPGLRTRLAAGARTEAERRMSPAQAGVRLLALLRRVVGGPVYDAAPPETP
jgi:colanic acid/amylovoran biosynthesis glycosyltransferase